MARIELKGTPVGVIVDRDGRPRAGVAFTLTGGTLYAGSTGTTPQSSLVTNGDGEAPGWLEHGVYVITDTTTGEQVTFEVGGGNTAARKPGTAADAFGLQFQFVSEKDGDDANDGLSWGPGNAKKQIGAALAALPNGGLIFCAPGTYRPPAKLTLNGHRLIALAGVNGGSAVNAKTTITHGFNGDLIQIQGGGGVDGFVLMQMGNYTGAAIKAVSTTAARTGLLFLDNLITASNDGINGFERNLDLDGSADSTAGGPGLRSVFAHNLQLFGAKIAGENVRLNRVIHAFFTHLEIVQAPETSVQQGIKILHTESEEIYFNGAYVLGDFNSEAEDPTKVILNGTVTGANNGPERFRPVTFAGAWVNFAGGWQAAQYRKSRDGRVQLRGKIKSGTIGTTAFTLPAGFAPPAALSFGVDSNGSYGNVQVGSGGAVTPTVGTNVAISLDGIEFQAA